MAETNKNLDTLELLIQAEKTYIDTLDIIDSKLSPLWMKQLDSVAPEFSELLKCIQDIITISKSFYEKLTNMNSQNDLGELLMHLTRDIKMPYHNYSENFINNINQHQDILCTPSIQKLLHDIRAEKQDKQEESVTLETLFYAPLHQLNIYKSLFNRDNIDINQQILNQANHLFDNLMIKNSLPAVNLDSFHAQVDCSKVVDVLSDKPISNYQLQSLSKVLLCDTFHCSELSKRVRLILTVNNLIFYSVEEDNNKDLKYTLLFTPVPTKYISIRTVHTDRELIGEYNVQFWIQKQKLFTMKSNSKEDRNMWLGLDINSSTRDQSLLYWMPLIDTVATYDIRRQSSAKGTSAPKPIRTQDIFTFYTDQAAEISPLVSSSEDESEDSEDDDNTSWKEEEAEEKINSKTDSVDRTDKSQSLDKEIIAPFSSASNTNSMLLEHKSLPPPPPVPEKNIVVIPNLPLELPNKNTKTPPSSILSGTESLTSRNTSLKQLPIPSSMRVPDAITPNDNSSPVPTHNPNVRPMSAHQSLNGRPVSYQERQLQQQPLSPSNSPYLQQQQQQQLPDNPIETSSKKNSFLRSVMAAVSSPRSSFRLQKSTSKSSLETIEGGLDSSSNNGSNTRASSLRGPTKKVGVPNMSTVSLDQQTARPTDHNASLRRYSAANLAEPPTPPQHLNIPPPPSPFGSRSSFINNQSTPSFISSINSSSQSSLALTPPLSRSSSPGSMTPVSLNRYTTPSSSSSEDLGSPPKSPDIITHGNTIKNVLYSNNQVRVFHWKDESWYAVEEECLLEVRQTFANRSCVAIHMKNTGQLYLNAWVLPDTFIIRTSETDLSLSLHITNNQSALENYLFHCESQLEADRLSNILEQMHQESIQMNMVISATSTLRGAPPVLMRSSSLAAVAPNNTLSQEDIAKGFKLAMQCKCKLFVQSSTAKWNSFGSVYMKVSQQYATKKMHVAMESHKGGKTTQLVSAMVQSRNVERLGQKRITFLLVDEFERNSVVYMVQVREELTGDKIFEYIKTKNAENGW